MHAGRHYSLRQVATWTRRETLQFLVVSTAPVLLELGGVSLVYVPWQPIALLGMAVAFVTGFKTNAAYGRLWEARQVWGAIVNASRSWAVLARDFVITNAEPIADDDTHARLLYRHVAWLTALRHQLRQPRVWESAQLRENVEFREHTFVVPERANKLDEELAAFLTPAELQYVLTKQNRATAVVALQSASLQRLAALGRLTEFRHVELSGLLQTLYDQQGKCERIKNFPYPRQFATLNLMFIWTFIVLLPLGVISELKRANSDQLWIAIPITVLVAWVFHTMDKIGDASENPFEGGPNDVPITAMSRGIEIDLKDLLNEPNLPEPHKPRGDILM